MQGTLIQHLLHYVKNIHHMLHTTLMPVCTRTLASSWNLFQPRSVMKMS